MQWKLIALLFLAIGITAIAKADSISWSGPAAIEFATCNSCPSGATPYVFPYQDGLNADVSVDLSTTAWGYGPSSGFELTIPFTLSEDTNVALSGIAAFNAGGSSCAAFGCANLTGWDFTGGFSGQAVIEGTGVALGFGGTQTTAATCDEGVCTGGVNLSQQLEATEDLPAGEYILRVQGSDSDSSIGDSGADLSFQFKVGDPPSPVPEPSCLYLSLIGMLGCFLFRRFARRSRRVEV